MRPHVSTKFRSRQSRVYHASGCDGCLTARIISSGELSSLDRAPDRKKAERANSCSWSRRVRERTRDPRSKGRCASVAKYTAPRAARYTTTTATPTISSAVRVWARAPSRLPSAGGGAAVITETSFGAFAATSDGAPAAVRRRMRVVMALEKDTPRSPRRAASTCRLGPSASGQAGPLHECGGDCEAGACCV